MTQLPNIKEARAWIEEWREEDSNVSNNSLDILYDSSPGTMFMFKIENGVLKIRVLLYTSGPIGFYTYQFSIPNKVTFTKKDLKVVLDALRNH
jgi:hypothetical protein